MMMGYWQFQLWVALIGIVFPAELLTALTILSQA